MSEGSEPQQLSGEEIAGLAVGGIAAVRILFLTKRGETCLQENRWDKAASAFQGIINACNIAGEFGIIDVTPPSWAYYKLGLALEQIPNLPKATEALEQAIAVDPADTLARIALARVAVERSDYNRALDEYKKAYIFVEDNRDKYGKAEADRKACEILAHLGSLLISMERQAEAEAVLRQAISIHPDHPRALANYAMIAAGRGDEVNLRKYLGMALEKARRGVDDDLINDLLQDAPNTDLGIVILEMMLAHRQIVNSVFTHQRKAWLRRREEVHKKPDSFYIQTEGGPVMTSQGEFYSTRGSYIGAMGRNATNNGTIQQVNQVMPESDFNMLELAAELDQLKSRMLSQATDPGHFHVVAEIESAKRAAEKSDQTALRTHLKAGGQWALEVASKVGASVAETAIRAALNLPR